MAGSPDVFTSNFPPSQSTDEFPASQRLIDALKLKAHEEGGYFTETDRNLHKIPNPFLSSSETSNATSATASSSSDETRSASTQIYYLLKAHSPVGYFHRNKASIYHFLHTGKARYVIIH